MQKDFDSWNKAKKNIDEQLKPKFYHEREIWFCSFGTNVGTEVNGTGKNFDRPVLVIKGFNKKSFFGVALTSRNKQGKYYFPIGLVGDKDALVNLSQVRTFDTKRLIAKVGMLETKKFLELTQRLRDTLLETTIYPRKSEGEAEAISTNSITPSKPMSSSTKIYVAGHRGLVGSAIVRQLEKGGYTNIIIRTRAELDLTDRQAVADFFASEKPEYVFDAAAKVGGILANDTYPADFLLQNLRIQNNIISSAHDSGVTKLLFLGSSCIYPKLAEQPIKEESLLTGLLESTNDAYAIAKIAGITLCQSYRKQYSDNFISVMPTNLYGQNDNFDLETSHVLPALLRKVHEAKETNSSTVEAWGTGSPMREFLYVDDLADACIYMMQTYNEPEIVNIGTGVEISIKDLTEVIKEIVDYKGEIIWDTTKPDGTPRKLLDVSKLHSLGFHHTISLKEGIEKTYAWYLSHNT